MTPARSATVRWLAVGLAAAGVLVLATIGLVSRQSGSPASALASNPDLDPGTRLGGPAPDFTLTDQFGRPVSLHSFRGRVVILAFNDSECTTICPLTTTAMVDAKRLLGAAGSQVQLLGIDANPSAVAVKDVRAYSESHGMMRQWQFATGSPTQLRRVWRAYHIEVAIEAGQIDHTPALFVIDTHGKLARLYITQQAYAAVDQLGQILARQASGLLPGHPRVNSSLSYGQIPSISPATRATLPGASGEPLALGPGRTARLFLFFATWDSQVTNLGSRLEALNGYQFAAATGRLPPLSAVDEASVEPSGTALQSLLHGLRRQLAYPVAIDRSGRVADGYGVRDQPWFVLTSASGQILWYYDVSTQGWLSTRSLAAHVRAALARPPKVATGAAAVQQELAGSAAPLAAIHKQAGALLGSEPALVARLRALRGYPVVLNAWASWCGPCRSEFGLFASASARYGRQVAFLGADTDDAAGDAQAFLARHPVTYPSYQTTTSQLGSVASILGLPTTIFIDRAGRVAFVHTGQYVSQGTMDADIASYALGH
jgi:cytochrome oxidase Cu insertion factor (SCO1/SenC/PrrC family)/thiol-disulfide isomerase/thioredoxin